MQMLMSCVVRAYVIQAYGHACMPRIRWLASSGQTKDVY